MIALWLGVGSVSGVRPRLLVHHVVVRDFIKRERGRKEKRERNIWGETAPP